jgi:uncharacterized membrane protein YphA (DoxX/SURF4 family)
MGAKTTLSRDSFLSGKSYSHQLVRSSCPRRPRLQKLFSTFPEGWPGLGLILMRLAVALSAIVHGFHALIESQTQTLNLAMELFEILVGTALLIGFLTPIAAASALLSNLATGVSSFLKPGENAHDKAIAALYLGVISIAITLLGPGGFSLDAHLFGRREIIIPGTPRRPVL